MTTPTSGPAAAHLRVAAVDLGATSGRVMVGEVRRDRGVAGGWRVGLAEAHRFPNGAVRAHGSLFWDVLGIHRATLEGLRAVAAGGAVDGIGIDSWAIDYGLLDRDGHLLGNPYSHRDARTDGVSEQALAVLGADEFYRVTGLQSLPFTTVFQLVAARGTAALESAEQLLLLPDLLTYWLTGVTGAERTNASTTGLYDATTRTWSTEVARSLELPWSILPPLRDPGTVVGPLLGELAHDLGLPAGVPVVSVASHDTASAVVGVPAQPEEDFAYISSGTWSLVGMEVDEPVLTDAARRADFTNEAGLDGTVRFLKNVTGLWVLSEAVRTWSVQGIAGTDLPTLLAGAADVPALRCVVDINDPRLLPPGPMPTRIRTLAQKVGMPVPETPAEVTRCILDSLALAYRRCVRTAAELTGRTPSVVHVVGGGTQNALLCQLTADAIGLPVIAGPAEAAALGNVLVQARALGADLPDLAAMREAVRASTTLTRYAPRPGADWDRAEQVLSSRMSGSPV